MIVFHVVMNFGIVLILGKQGSSGENVSDHFRDSDALFFSEPATNNLSTYWHRINQVRII